MKSSLAGGPAGRFHAVGAVASWLLGFGVTCRLIGLAVPLLDLPPVVREKLAHLASHGEEYDACFLGSSRIQNHVMPELFDRMASEHGIKMKSFNAGVSGMHPPEDSYMLDQILERRHARLRWIFVEVDYFDPKVPSDQVGTMRGVYWHDWQRFALLCRRLIVMEKRRHGVTKAAQIQEHFQIFREHALLFAQRFANLGRGSQSSDRWIGKGTVAPMSWKQLGENQGGWLPAGTDSDEPSANQFAGLQNELDECRRHPPLKDEADSVTQAALTSMLRKITNSGAQPILIIPPRARKQYFYPGYEIGKQCLVVNFCDPQNYPELYLIENRVDTSHLNPSGAEIFTRLLAQRFLGVARKP